jgi:hypothetical protein
MKALSEWQNFYVIVGSSAGALIGLQFVVIALIANLPRTRGQALAGTAFATPTIVHFTAVLLLAGAMSAPWHGVAPAMACWALAGVSGLAYEFVITLRMRQQTAYKPEFEDWLFHSELPLLAYGVLTSSAFAAFFLPRLPMFGVAFAALLLLIIGIHNAWDIVTYHVFVKEDERQDT